MRRLLAAPIALLALTTFVTACGDDDENDTGASSSEVVDGTDDESALSKDEFIAQGDAICSDLRDAAGEIEAPSGPEDFGRALHEAADLGKDARDDFAALQPPSDGEAVHQALLDALDANLEALEGAATAADDGDTVSAEDLAAQGREAGNAADADAREYGFEECGKESAEG